MKRSLSPVVLGTVVIALLIGLTACDDPSNVGLGLVGDQGGRPQLATASVTAFERDEYRRPENIPERVLAGRVVDPVIGTVTAQGYFDVTPVSSSGFRQGTVQSAELRLLPTYIYGDTTAELTLSVRPVLEEWSDSGLPIDTSFSVDEVIREFTFHPSDSLVVVPLPSEWVAAYDEVLRSSQFSEQFHGFRLDYVSGNAVVGIGPTSTSLFARTASDSVALPLGKAYSALQKEEPPNFPAGRLPVQVGVGPEARFIIEFDDEIASSAINSISLTFHADTSVPADPGFHRPPLRVLDLYGIVEGGGGVLLSRGNLDDDGRFVFRSSVLAREIQGFLLGRRTFQHFELRAPSPATTPNDLSELGLLPATINTILLFDTSAAERAPSASLTITPINE